MLLLEANRHSPGPERDLSREVHKAEWRIKEQKLKDDIRGLREKLTGLVCAGGAWGRGEGFAGGGGGGGRGVLPCSRTKETSELLESPWVLKTQSSRLSST